LYQAAGSSGLVGAFYQIQPLTLRKIDVPAQHVPVWSGVNRILLLVIMTWLTWHMIIYERIVMGAVPASNGTYLRKYAPVMAVTL